MTDDPDQGDGPEQSPRLRDIVPFILAQYQRLPKPLKPIALVGTAALAAWGVIGGIELAVQQYQDFIAPQFAERVPRERERPMRVNPTTERMDGTCTFWGKPAFVEAELDIDDDGRKEKVKWTKGHTTSTRRRNRTGTNRSYHMNVKVPRGFMDVPLGEMGGWVPVDETGVGTPQYPAWQILRKGSGWRAKYVAVGVIAGEPYEVEIPPKEKGDKPRKGRKCPFDVSYAQLEKRRGGDGNIRVTWARGKPFLARKDVTVKKPELGTLLHDLTPKEQIEAAVRKYEEELAKQGKRIPDFGMSTSFYLDVDGDGTLESLFYAPDIDNPLQTFQVNSRVPIEGSGRVNLRPWQVLDVAGEGTWDSPRYAVVRNPLDGKLSVVGVRGDVEILPRLGLGFEEPDDSGHRELILAPRAHDKYNIFDASLLTTKDGVTFSADLFDGRKHHTYQPFANGKLVEALINGEIVFHLQPGATAENRLFSWNAEQKRFVDDDFHPGAVRGQLKATREQPAGFVAAFETGIAGASPYFGIGLVPTKQKDDKGRELYTVGYGPLGFGGPTEDGRMLFRREIMPGVMVTYRAPKPGDLIAGISVEYTPKPDAPGNDLLALVNLYEAEQRQAYQRRDKTLVNAHGIPVTTPAPPPKVDECDGNDVYLGKGKFADLESLIPNGEIARTTGKITKKRAQYRVFHDDASDSFIVVGVKRKRGKQYEFARCAVNLNDKVTETIDGEEVVVHSPSMVKVKMFGETVEYDTGSGDLVVTHKKGIRSYRTKQPEVKEQPSWDTILAHTLVEVPETPSPVGKPEPEVRTPEPIKTFDEYLADQVHLAKEVLGEKAYAGVVAKVRKLGKDYRTIVKDLAKASSEERAEPLSAQAMYERIAVLDTLVSSRDPDARYHGRVNLARLLLHAADTARFGGDTGKAFDLARYADRLVDSLGGVDDPRTPGPELVGGAYPGFAGTALVAETDRVMDELR